MSRSTLFESEYVFLIDVDYFTCSYTLSDRLIVTYCDLATAGELSTIVGARPGSLTRSCLACSLAWIRIHRTPPARSRPLLERGGEGSGQGESDGSLCRRYGREGKRRPWWWKTVETLVAILAVAFRAVFSTKYESLKSKEEAGDDEGGGAMSMAGAAGGAQVGSAQVGSQVGARRVCHGHSLSACLKVNLEFIR